MLEARVPTSRTCIGCLELARTVDGGSSWSLLPSPPGRFAWSGPRATGTERVSKVVFANRSDGYLYGPGLLVTNDGGRSWSAPRLPGAASLVIAGGRALAITKAASRETERLWSAPLGSTRWAELALPAPARLGISELVAARGTVLALQQGDVGAEPRANDLGRLWMSRDVGRTWKPERIPCTVHDGGAAVVAIELGRPNSWLVDCYDNLQSSQQLDTQHHLYRTTDAGGHWTRLPDPARRGAPVTLAANATGQAMLATQSAQDSVFATVDGGRRWHLVLDDGGDFFGFDGPHFATRSFAYLVAPTHYAPTHLYLTDNAGRSWRVVRLG